MNQDSDNERVNMLGSLFDNDDSSSDEGGHHDHRGEEALVEEVYVRRPPSGRVLSPPTLRLSLVCARHSLWGHRLWNAALLLAEMFDGGDLPVEGKTVLELGAGAGLPGLICALKGARKVVISDYATSTDKSLMVPIGINIDRIQPEFVPRGTLHAVAHVWGQPVDHLLEPLATRTERFSSGSGARLEPPVERSGRVGRENGDLEEGNHEQNVLEIDTGTAKVGGEGTPRGGDRLRPTHDRVSRCGDKDAGFDVVIMADLLFNRSQHAQLLDSCDRCLGRSGTSIVWVCFSHHDPQKAELDMKFFELAGHKGFSTTRYKTVHMRNLFVENDGMDDLRGEVHLWCLTRGKC